ncbi:MAG: 16S rRNA (guanine(966)-N(2))-methyltransferase RsmD [Actinomycetota bacterium]
MRVIAGTAKGVRLAPVPAGTRPVSDMAREGLFSSLGEDVADARVLDLWAGTGALAIEALSRGATSAVLVERGRSALAAIAENLRRAHVADRARVVRGDAVRFLPPAGELPYDLVFLDPPYEEGPEALDPVLARLAGGLPEGATIVLTRASRSSTPVIPVPWAITRRLEYGDTLVLACRRR